MKGKHVQRDVGERMSDHEGIGDRRLGLASRVLCGSFCFNTLIEVPTTDLAERKWRRVRRRQLHRCWRHSPRDIGTMTSQNQNSIRRAHQPTTQHMLPMLADNTILPETAMHPTTRRRSTRSKPADRGNAQGERERVKSHKHIADENMGPKSTCHFF